MVQRADAPPRLQLLNIGKQFITGQPVLRDLCLTLQAGEIVALLGDNGAGKSTLIKILAGMESADSGQIYFEGQPIDSALSLKRKKQQPIAFIHQQLGLIESMSVAENMAFMMGFITRWGRISWPAVKKQAQQALQRIGVELDVECRVEQLSQSEKTLLTIACVMSLDAKVIVLDEVSASLPAGDVERLFLLLNQLKQKQLTILYVTHRLHELSAITDRQLFLQQGRLIESAARLPQAATLCRAAVARPALSHQVSQVTLSSSAARLSVSNIGTAKLAPLSFDLYPGEIVGLAGERHGGQTAIGELLFGLRPLITGQMLLNAKVYQPKSPRLAITAGVAYIGASWQQNILSGFNVRENVFLNPQVYQPAGRLLNRVRLEQVQINRVMASLAITPADGERLIDELSGGNQQKVVLARWLYRFNQLVILNDPSAGLDSDTRVQLYHLLQQQLAKGSAILLISSDFAEIASLCHRALVFYQGQLVNVLTGAELNEQSLYRYSNASLPACSGAKAPDKRRYSFEH